MQTEFDDFDYEYHIPWRYSADLLGALAAAGKNTNFTLIRRHISRRPRETGRRGHREYDATVRMASSDKSTAHRRADGRYSKC